MRNDVLKNFIFNFTILVVVMSLGAVVYVKQDNWIVTTITTLTTVGGVFAVWLQMRDGKKLNEGEFILNLRKQFVDNPHIYQMTVKLEKYERSDKIENPFNEDDISDIATYMTFFEVMYLLIKRNIIQLFMIDLLFAFHFFILINNDKIQTLELLPCQDYYLDVFKLYHEWVNFRKAKNLPVFLEKDSILKAIRPDLLKKVLEGRND